jgi:hypothetical protein
MPDLEATDLEPVDLEIVDLDTIGLEVDGEADSDPDRNDADERRSVPLRLVLGGKLIPETLYLA